MDTWNPTQYGKFLREREQPFFDLLALVHPLPAMRVVDLGCGTGKLTRVLHETLKARETTGLDRSARMLDLRPESLQQGLRFELGTIESFASDGEYDLIFSNAALQWVQHHELLIHRLFAALKPGGQLAFQVPAMNESPSHMAAEALADTDEFRTAFSDWRPPLGALKPEEYAQLLHTAGFSKQHVRLVIYPHLLPGREDVVEWMKGSLLTAYERRLTPEQFDKFVDRYQERLLRQLGPERPFFFPFARILCWGQRSA
jgi:trans-aconitate 2-methyltransferase